MNKVVLPLILCGRHANISKAASEALKPQFHVIHTCLSVESAKEEIPHLLYNSSKSSERIAGVVLGGGFDKESFEQIRKSVKMYKSNLFTTWLRNDLKIKYHNNPFLPGKQELYGQEVGQRAKKRLLSLLKEGQLQSPKDEVYLF